MIEHHNYFKVHLPKKEYKSESDSELTEILMEELYLLSDGKLTEAITQSIQKMICLKLVFSYQSFMLPIN
mgnify:CR=1 FL=1